MKNSKEYSTKIKKLYRSLKARYPKVKKVFYDEPAEALVYAIISENMSEQETESAIKRFADYFVDLNDLRVSRTEEIIDVLGQETQNTKDTASTIIKALRHIFDTYNSVSLMALKKIGKRQARQVLEKMDSISRFATNYCMLTSLQSHTIPLTKNMIEHLRNNELVHPDADEKEIEGFLAKQISAENAYEFYSLLRASAESKKDRKKTKTASKKQKKTSKTTKKKRKK